MPRREPIDRALALAGAPIALLGLVMAAGGRVLLSVGGSVYYLLAGVALLAATWLLWRRDARAVWLYAAVLVATLIWTMLETGLDWILVGPRVGLIALVGAPLLLPGVSRRLTWPAGRRRPPLAAGLGLAALLLVGATILAPPVPPQTDTPMLATTRQMPVAQPTSGPLPAMGWTNIGRDLSGNRFVPAGEITPANVGRLKLAWTTRTGDLPNGLFSVEGPPLQAGGRLFVCTPNRRVVALDAETGKLLWRFVPALDSMVSQNLPMCRGVSYHEDPVRRAPCAAEVFVTVPDGSLWALDAATGRPCPGFGRGGVISLLEGIGAMTMRDTVNTTPGTVIGDLIVIGGQVADGKNRDVPSGVIRAWDVHSGRLAWAWDMGAPDRIGAPPAGQTYTRSTPNSWMAFAADPALGLVYLPMGNPSPDFFGAYRRPFDEKYGTSLVALDVRTGRPRWSFQMVHHDLWDLDLPAQPVLADWPTPAGPRKAVVQLTKMGDIYVLDRATGRPILPVREVPVPQGGGVPDDRRAATQPVSALSFAPRRLREADMWGLTPIDQMLCRIALPPHALPGRLHAARPHHRARLSGDQRHLQLERRHHRSGARPADRQRQLHPVGHPPDPPPDRRGGDRRGEVRRIWPAPADRHALSICLARHVQRARHPMQPPAVGRAGRDRHGQRQGRVAAEVWHRARVRAARSPLAPAVHDRHAQRRRQHHHRRRRLVHRRHARRLLARL